MDYRLPELNYAHFDRDLADLRDLAESLLTETFHVTRAVRGTAVTDRETGKVTVERVDVWTGPGGLKMRSLSGFFEARPYAVGHYKNVSVYTLRMPHGAPVMVGDIVEVIESKHGFEGRKFRVAGQYNFTYQSVKRFMGEEVEKFG